jgi:NAD(P)-dependent dehydrogenase (short-subunit alcohol dehydrogenase family)
LTPPGGGTYASFAGKETMIGPKVVLISGASTGIGRAIAGRLADRGFTVFGTSRRPAEYASPRDWELVELDVRSDESVARCLGLVLDKAGRVDALVNNAGYVLSGAVEEATLDQVRAAFDTNVFGAVRLIKAVLPHLRRQASGTIVNISSGNAALRLPFSGHYVAGKCALEGLSACLRRELKPLGIHVSVIEPGFFRSNIGETAQQCSDGCGAYEPWETAWGKTMRRSVETGPDPAPVAACVVKILSKRRPRYLYVVGGGLRLARRAKQFLPEDIFYWGIQRALRVNPKTGDGLPASR